MCFRWGMRTIALSFPESSLDLFALTIITMLLARFFDLHVYATCMQTAFLLQKVVYADNKRGVGHDSKLEGSFKS